MTMTTLFSLHAVMSIGILLTPFLIIIVTIFNLLFNLFAEFSAGGSASSLTTWIQLTNQMIG